MPTPPEQVNKKLNQDFLNKLTLVANALHLSEQEAAAIVGVSSTNLSHIRANRRNTPKESFIRIHDVMGYRWAPLLCDRFGLQRTAAALRAVATANAAIQAQRLEDEDNGNQEG